MPQYNEAVIIDGTQDEVQLQVQGHSPQAEPLQTWETSNFEQVHTVTEFWKVG